MTTGIFEISQIPTESNIEVFVGTLRAGSSLGLASTVQGKRPPLKIITNLKDSSSLVLQILAY